MGILFGPLDDLEHSFPFPPPIGRFLNLVGYVLAVLMVVDLLVLGLDICLHLLDLGVLLEEEVPVLSALLFLALHIGGEPLDEIVDSLVLPLQLLDVLLAEGVVLLHFLQLGSQGVEFLLQGGVALRVHALDLFELGVLCQQLQGLFLVVLGQGLDQQVLLLPRQSRHVRVQQSECWIRFCQVVVVLLVE